VEFSESLIRQPFVVLLSHSSFEKRLPGEESV
jgi:hypothetical protein